ncbi:uncharacterized protein [Eleutherodactylus coqui]|uniref:uncharacterized protein n=1 Tax=Eleutherodactylus coqui TaxID=57060 RepID=UPI0034631E70
MKLVVIFLCLSVASFIGTSTGSGGTSVTMTKECVIHITFFCASASKNCNCAETCADGEKSTWQKATCDDLICTMTIFAQLYGLTLEAFLIKLGFAVAEIEAILTGDCTRIIAAFNGNLKNFLARVLYLVQYALAQLGYVLGNILTVILTTWNCKGVIPWLPSLLGDVNTILTTTTGSLTNLNCILGNVLGATGVLGLIVSILTGLLSALTGSFGGMLKGC